MVRTTYEEGGLERVDLAWSETTRREAQEAAQGSEARQIILSVAMTAILFIVTFFVIDLMIHAGRQAAAPRSRGIEIRPLTVQELR